MLEASVLTLMAVRVCIEAEMGVSCYILDTCWVGQEVRLGFPVTSDEKDVSEVSLLIFQRICVHSLSLGEALLTGRVS